jgi:hypothetical protein
MTQRQGFLKRNQLYVNCCLWSSLEREDAWQENTETFIKTSKNNHKGGHGLPEDSSRLQPMTAFNQKLLQGVQGDGFLEKSPPGRRGQNYFLNIKSPETALRVILGESPLLKYRVTKGL